MSQYDLVIKNGTVVTATTTYRADVAINGEQIAAIGADLSGEHEIDATGKYVIPGGVDIHVHMQMSLGGDVISSDDFFTGTRAAAFGGTTTIVDFVEAKPDEKLVDALARRRSEADPKVTIDYGLHMTLGPNEIGRLDQVAEAYAAGCATFKMYMAYGFYLDDGQLYRALRAIRDTGGQPILHAENWPVICALIEENLAKGNTEPRWHPRSRPASLEGESVGRAIDIAEYVGLPLHIFHVSCVEAVERIQAARARGLPITGETCPQYLFMNDTAFEAPGVKGMLPVCAPPIREQAQQDGLWQALSNGDLQMVTTDHCPFTQEIKARGEGNYSKIAGGVPSIEMRLSGIYSGGVVTGKLSLNDWVALCCTNPAKLARLPQKGDIAPGKDADIVVFDPNKAVTLSTDTLHENVDWTLYDGIDIQGWPAITISRGRVIVENGEFVGEGGQGQFIARQ